MGLAAEKKESGYDLSIAFMILRDTIIEGGGEMTPNLEARWGELMDEIFKKQNAYVWVLNSLDARMAALRGEVQLHKHKIQDLQNKIEARENDKDRLKETAVQMAELTGVFPVVDGYKAYLQQFQSVNDNATFETVPDRYKKMNADITLNCPEQFIKRVKSRVIDKNLLKSDYKSGDEELEKFISKKNQMMIK